MLINGGDSTVAFPREMENRSLAMQVDKIRCCEICPTNFDALFNNRTGKHIVTTAPQC